MMERVPKLVAAIGIAQAIAAAGVASGQVRIDPFRPDAPKAAGAGTAQGPGVINSAEMVDAPITTVFKMISDLTGWSIIMSPEVSKAPPKINIWIRNLTPEQVLDRVGAVGGLVIEKKGNTVEVMTFDEFTKLRGVEKHVILLKNARARQVAANLQPFLTKDQTKVLADDDGNKLILLVPQPLLASLIRLVDALDAPYEKDLIRVVILKHLEAAVLLPKLERFLSDTSRNGARGGLAPFDSGGAGGAPAGAPTVQAAEAIRAGDRWLVQFMVEPKLNAIVLRGLARDVTQTEALMISLDVPPDVKVVSYPLRYTNAREVFRTIQELINEELQAASTSGGGIGGGGRDAPRMKVTASEQNNQIIAEGSPHDHARIAHIISVVDRALPPSSGGIRVYRLENSTAKDVVRVIDNLIKVRTGGGPSAVQERSGAAQSGIQRHDAFGSRTGGGGTGAGRGGTGGTGTTSGDARGTTGGTPAGPGGAASGGAGENGADARGGATAESMSADVIPAQVSVAEEINAVVIRASAAEHEEFATLIRELDRPRDQVMLEVTLVTVRTASGFNIGVELGGARVGSGGTNAIGFSSFGVGAVDPATGAIRIASPAPFGLNVGVFQSDDFSVVFNALKTVGDTRIVSTPKILVEDNASAEIKQLNREPFATTSQGDNTTLVGFGGFAEAGTSLTVVPRLSKDEWLRLEYQVNLSSFDQRTAQQLAANLPPPVRQNTSQGTVRIPGDYTVVLGGLSSTRDERVKDGVPLLGDLPLIGYLFSNQSKNHSTETLFIFIRPVVLRELGFSDLRLLSREDVRRARVLSSEFPENGLKLLTPGVAADTKGEDR